MDRKADQISSHFYTKLFYVVCEAREAAKEATGTSDSSSSKVDKWFNLSTPSPTRPGRSPPFAINVVLVLPDIKPTQVVVSLPTRTALPPATREILLERWSVSVVTGNDEEHDLPIVYKHGIPLFRGAWSLLRVLPTWRMRGKFRRMGGRVQVNVVDAAPNPAWIGSPQTHSFPSVPHPRGSLTLTADYLPSPSFRVDERESLLSSRIRKEDEEDDWVPTLKSGAVASSVSRLRKDSTPGSSASTSSPLNPSKPQSIISSNSPRSQSILSTNSPRPPSLLSSSPARRPHPHPFKSDTLSGSLSSVNIGGLTGLIASPSPSPAPAPFPTTTTNSASVSPSNALESRPARKRYSSSFGPRYAARSDSPGSSGSSFSERARVESTALDDDDMMISEFVKDIDARKPLRRPLATSPSSSPKTSSPLASSPGRGGLTMTNPGFHQRAATEGGKVLTSQEAIAKEIDRMNDTFMRSLEGLGSGRRRD